MDTTKFLPSLNTHRDRLFSFAMNLTKNTDDAKDLLQETLLRALNNQEKFQEGTNLKAWLLTIMRNIFINNYRRKVKQNTIFDKSANDYLLDYQQSAIANEAESNLRIKEIQAAIHDLPVIFRQPFMLYFEGFKYHEIADMLSEPLGTIKSRIHFARRLLKEQISKY